MIRIKSATDAPDFKSPSRHANGSILEYVCLWRNAEDGLKDKQMGDFILTMGLKRGCLFGRT
ncbi:MAG TPA: hypothetical protein VJ879_07155 [Desulfobacter sp.]|nr:hypothetical protein [Desulfobacter sp.]